MSTVGFIGLGNMGGPMAANLVKAGFTVKGYDVVDQAQRKAGDAGVEIVTSPAEAADGADFLVTMLPKGQHVRDVLLGEQSPLSKLASGAIMIDCSSIDVPTSRDLNARGIELGIQVLDAPVSGGVSGATAGTLTFMVGGEESTVQKAQPVLDAMGSRVVVTGGPGAGQVAKACNQMVFGSSLAALAEAFTIAQRLGLEPQKLFDVLRTSSGDCWALHNFTPLPGLVENSAADNDYAPKFAAALLAKDLGLALTAANSAGVHLAVGKTALAMFDDMAKESGHLDASAVIKSIPTS
jgi:3-hydroxyisobutyrate dehydrogenase